MRLGSDFRELLRLLNESQVRYLIVGAYALAGYGFPRNTKDLDIFYEATPANAGKLLNALIQFGFGDLGLTVSDFDKPGQILQLGYPPNRVDLINTISGVEFEEAWINRLPIHDDEVRFDIIGKAEFIKNKKASGRLRDLADIEALGESPQ